MGDIVSGVGLDNRFNLSSIQPPALYCTALGTGFNDRNPVGPLTHGKGAEPMWMKYSVLCQVSFASSAAPFDGLIEATRLKPFKNPTLLNIASA